MDIVSERDACGVGFVADLNGGRSYEVLAKALKAVANLSHRGAVSADAKTGDGAGVLTQIPYAVLRPDIGIHVPDEDIAVGMLFLPCDGGDRAQAIPLIENAIGGVGLRLLGWREVPVNLEALGAHARDTRPFIAQVLTARAQTLPDDQFDRDLYLCRKRIERATGDAGLNVYVPSFSRRTIVYKGLFTSPQLPKFYLDLVNPSFETALAVFHQRYSTNTFPSWHLAQPFRFLAHNGEINTLQGNVHWMRAREPELCSAIWGDRIREVPPVIQGGGSDSAMLDNVVELLVHCGRDLPHALLMLVPEAWEGVSGIDEAIRAFYEYHGCLTEPWDGPAALAFSDGVLAGAALDRNGLRPARYLLTDDGLVVMASEAGVLDIAPEHIVEKGRLGPGQMVLVDTTHHVFLRDDEIKTTYARRQPYGEWIRRHLARLGECPSNGGGGDDGLLLTQQRAFGFTAEDLTHILRPMVAEGKDTVFSMGDDTPSAVLSSRPRLLYHYFKQRFAQVTNPAIDPLRERLVMSLSSYLGPRPTFLEESPEHARLLHLSTPILLPEELYWLREDAPIRAITLNAHFLAADGVEGLTQAVEKLGEAACGAVRDPVILIISDRGVDDRCAPVPMLLAVSAVHHELIRRGLRMQASIIAETGEARDIHHLASLIGYGASAVCPYLAFKTLAADPQTAGDVHQRWAAYRKAAEAGLLKIMSKMGISTLAGYCGAQIFEAVGLDSHLVDRYFPGTPSRVQGIGLPEIAEDVLERHREAFSRGTELKEAGYVRFRRDGEYHAFNPFVVKALHRAARNGDGEAYRAFAGLVAARPPTALRDLLEFVPQTPVPIEEVESVEAIVSRFVISAMSHGALSREAHETLAIAANRIGARSNTGEGGEDPARYRRWPEEARSSNSRIKQIASARFGVTPEYILSADELEIKMAQGSKPGEGGQLPGHKVSEEIARIRRAQPGITLISPAPHHDVYSIEDLAQLIYDLKRINSRARVAVKLVAEAGVGTIAAGVAKAFADTIQISGHDGGTGASPLDSIKNAGVPWELGLAETQQVLVGNDLRGRVRLRVDGGLKTGRDVVIAALLGADEFGFGTAAVVALGCVMTRECHLNTCPVGIATQREDLRLKFRGTPEMVIEYLRSVAAHVREILASLGARSIEEVIGRVELLCPKRLSHPKAKQLDFAFVLHDPDPLRVRPRRNYAARNNRVEDVNLDARIVADCRDALERGHAVQLTYPIRNVHRAVGAALAGEIIYRCGDARLPDGSVTVKFFGSAGQSFGAFCVPGLQLLLEGEANDFVGKGMAGGEIVIRPPRAFSAPTHRNVILGNTVLYGATDGRLFAAGRAGERFAVRNSGAVAVVEGVGDHCCEYMTGGIVVVLGEVGRNFAAGMTGGLAYVLDEHRFLPVRCNPEHVRLQSLSDAEDETRLVGLLEDHARLTGSVRVREILTRWPEYACLFWKVAPKAAATARPRGVDPAVASGSPRS